jgi:hypothetical protein
MRGVRWLRDEKQNSGKSMKAHRFTANGLV